MIVAEQQLVKLKLKLKFNDGGSAVSELKRDSMIVVEQHFCEIEIESNSGGLAVSELKRDSMLVVEQQ